MKKYILYDKKGNVKSVSDGLIGYDKNIFTLKEMKITDEENEKIKQNYTLRFIDKLEFEKHPDIILIEENKNKKKDFHDKVAKAKTISDIKEILLINKVKLHVSKLRCYYVILITNMYYKI